MSAVAVAACGGSNDDAAGSGDATSTAGASTSASAAPTTVQPTTGPTLPVRPRSRAGPLAALRAFRACLREHGVEVGRARDLIGSDDPDLEAALDACYADLAAAFAEAGLRPPGRGLLGSRPVTGPADELPEGDFPDPFGLETDDGLYVYGTNTADANVPVSHVEGDRLVISDAMPDLPAWTRAGFVWAPAVLPVDGGGYVLYYTSHDIESGLQCVGAAQGSDPLGPFADDSEAPLACPTGEGGAIDASPFVASDGTPYLLYKTDGNCCGLPTVIVSRELAPGGRAFAGEPVELVRNDLAWEGPVAEAPSMTLLDGRHLLVYSGGDWSDDSYAVGYAWCDGPGGPCLKQGDPFLATDDTQAGPGGAEALPRAGGLELIFHAWDPDAVGYEAGGARTVRLTGLGASGETLTTG